jgi:hypothetical protein
MIPPVRSVVPLFLCASASAQWSANPAQNLPVADQVGFEADPRVVASSDGSTWIGWVDGSSGGLQMRLQRLDPLGVETFPHTGLLVSAHPQDAYLAAWDMSADCSGGVILAFTDLRAGGDVDVYAYRVDANGAFLWGPNGVTLSTDGDFEINPILAVARDCQSVAVAWSRWPSGSPASLRLQRLDMAGVPHYAQDGIAIPIGSSESPALTNLVASDNGSCIVAWIRDASSSHSLRHLHTQKLDVAGNALWGATPVVVLDAWNLSTNWLPVLLSDGAGGAIYGWYTGNFTWVESFVQRLDANGVELYPHNGLQVSLRDGTHKVIPSLALCASGDLVVAYSERNSVGSRQGLSAQRISPAGTRIWGPNGIQISPLDATGEFDLRALAFGEGSIVACLQTVPTPSWTIGVRAVRLDPAGTPVWTPALVDVSVALGSKDKLVACLDGSGVLRCAWYDERSLTGDVYAQNVDCDGSLGNTSPAGWSNYCIGAPNSVGPGAVMSASGSTSLALDNFVLGCSGLPPTTNGIFFFGASQIQVPFGNGFRCVGGTVVRFGVQTTTPAGTVQRAIQQNLLPGGPIPAGATRDFQFWYRNPLAGGAGFNLSDGLAATFCP